MHLPSVSEWMVILVIIMMFFGVGKLPEVLKQFGKGVREFKDASEGVERKGRRRAEEDEDEDDDDERAAYEEFRRKRREQKQLTASRTPDAPRARDTASDDADGDNDDVGSAPVRKRST